MTDLADDMGLRAPFNSTALPNSEGFDSSVEEEIALNLEGDDPDRLVDTSAQRMEQRSINDYAVSDLDQNGYFNQNDLMQENYFIRTDEAIRLVADRIASDPGTSVAILGEFHTKLAADRFHATAVAVEDAGRRVIAAIETPSSPELDALIDRYQAGELSEDEFLDLGSAEIHQNYLKSYNNNGIPAGQETDREPPSDLAYWRQRLSDDVVAYHKAGIEVELVDDGRYVPGANRDAVMAEKIQRISEENPDAVVMAQLGVLHSQERSSIDFLPGMDINDDSEPPNVGVRGAVVQESDELRPAAERLSAALGEDRVLSIAIDDVRLWQGTAYPGLWIGASEAERTDLGEFVRVDSFDYILPTWDEGYTSDPNTNGPPVLTDLIRNSDG